MLRSKTKRAISGACVAWVVLGLVWSVEAQDAEKILEATGIKGGLIVHLGCSDPASARLTADFGAGDAFLVHRLDAEAANVEKARAHVRSLGRYGKVSVEHWDADRLPYVDNLVNLVVCEYAHGQVSESLMSEIMRVLAPKGVAYITQNGAWQKTVKPRPKNIDDWPHALHGADNNAVASDSVVGPPHHLHWLAGPRNARHHERLASVSVVVSEGGRVFYVIDEAPAASILLRPQWSVVARDAFSSVVLWKRRIRSWEPYMRGFRSGPPALKRRLAAADGRVYVTLDLRAPLTALDAATGKTVQTYEGTAATEEVLCSNGVLYLVVNESAGKKAPTTRTPTRLSIMALDAKSGRMLWRKADAQPMPTTLAVSGDRVFYQTSEAILCLNAKTGEQVWRHNRPCAVKRPGWSCPTLVVHDGVVLCADRHADLGRPEGQDGKKKRKPRWDAAATAGGPGELVALSADSGEKLWSCECAEAYHAPVDVFVIDGLVWVGQSRMRRDEDFTAGRDLRTGEIKRRLSTAKAFLTTMPHHRCHRNRATNRYIILGRTGIEFIDVRSGEAFRHHWARGTCQYGFIPANGLLYAPPHSCACYIEAKLAGFFAFTEKQSKMPSSTKGNRLERGPAYDTVREPKPEIANQGDWPTFRHDAARSGWTRAAVSPEPRLTWQAKLGGKLSSPVIAGGKVFVAAVDAHTVHALDAASGKAVWSYTVGGRVDSPPTVAGQRVVFGSADGCVYCLRASDGALVWRCRAAPEARRTVAFDQVESVWPVHGSVLVRDGSVYCAVGRSSYLDGGLYVIRLDLKTGKKLAEKRFYSRDVETGQQPQEPDTFEMPGALPDILSCDGDLIYMRHIALDPKDLQRREAPAHLYSPAGFLNDDWWHRTYWIYGTHFYSGYIGWFFAGREAPAGRILSIDDSTIYGFGYLPELYRGATGRKYQLFAADKSAQAPQPKHDYKTANRRYPHRGKGQFNVEFRWAERAPLLVRAMVLAGDTLFVAGPPDRALRSTRAFMGERGGLLRAVSAEEGKTLKEYRLDALPVFDGLAAANGRLYMTTEAGGLLCMSEAGTPLSDAVEGKKSVAGKPIEPGLVGYYKLDEGKGEETADSSGLGNDGEVYGQWAKGAFGTCLFTGAMPGALTLWDGPHLHFGTGDFSVEFWLTVNEFGKRLMGKSKFPQSWWVINLLGDGRPEMVLGESTGKGKSVRPKSNTPLTLGEWNHVAFVVSRSTSEVKCYMNGKLDSTTKIPPTITCGFSIEGRDLKAPEGNAFVGLFDELKLYKRALTDEEIGRSYEKEKGNRTSAEFEYTGG